MFKRKKARFSRARWNEIVRYPSRRTRRRAGLSGVMGDIVAGAAIGIGVRALSPHINRYVPSVLGLSPQTIATLGGGVAAKTLLHKGGKFSNAAIVLGSAMAASELMGGFMGNGATVTGQTNGSYANDQ
jgi:hypothetical protein